MNFLFCHRNFPAQFRETLFELAKDPANKIVFIAGNPNVFNIKGVDKIIYKLKREVPADCHRYLRIMEESVIHGQAAAEAALNLKLKGFIPDIIYSHSWGNSLFLKDVFPNAIQVNYCEWYYNTENSDMDFNGRITDINKLASTKCQNAPLLIDLVNCDFGICPTEWQKSQIPKEFHHKITVMHEGVDTEFFVPNKDVLFKVPNTDIVLSAKDEVITYATRGMESYRGFPEFIKIADKLLKMRPNLHVLIGGEDRICYGPKPPVGNSWKEYMLNKIKLDESRVHFTGSLPYGEYLKLLQVSKVHTYLTYPFVLSWSFLEAMAVECPIVASDTACVQEVMENNKEGYLFDFYNIDAFVNKINYILDNPDSVKEVRQNARRKIVEKYNQRKLVKKQVDFLKGLKK